MFSCWMLWDPRWRCARAVSWLASAFWVRRLPSSSSSFFSSPYVYHRLSIGSFTFSYMMCLLILLWCTLHAIVPESVALRGEQLSLPGRLRGSRQTEPWDHHPAFFIQGGPMRRTERCRITLGEWHFVCCHSLCLWHCDTCIHLYTFVTFRKVKFPENFFLLRGNHECASITRIYGRLVLLLQHITALHSMNLQVLAGNEFIWYSTGSRDVACFKWMECTNHHKSTLKCFVKICINLEGGLTF